MCSQSRHSLLANLTNGVQGEQRLLFLELNPSFQVFMFGSAVSPIMSMCHRFFTPPCLCSTMSMFHLVYVPPFLYSTLFMFHHVYVSPCLCSTVSLLHHVYVPPLTGGFYVPSCLAHRVYVSRVYVPGLGLGIG